MASRSQLTLFGWKEIEKLGDLERLRLIFEYMPDEELRRPLKKGKGVMIIRLGQLCIF